MRVVKAVLVTGLFLLIPFQGPFAGPADGGGPADVGVATDAAAGSLPKGTHARRASVPNSEGFVWSVRTTHAASVAGAPPEHRETDGYSWSVRTVGSTPALDPTP